MPDTAYQAHADQRTADILASARRAFVEKGFDGASMQDLARTAGMSVGNFYRYFPSKAAIVEALIAQDLDTMSRDFRAILTAPVPSEALRQTIRDHVMSKGCDGDGALWAEISAAALRKPEIGAITCNMETQIVENLAKVFALVTGLSETEARHRFSTEAGLIVLLVKAAAMQDAAGHTDNAPVTEMVLRIIDQTLDAIAASALNKG